MGGGDALGEDRQHTNEVELNCLCYRWWGHVQRREGLPVCGVWEKRLGCSLFFFSFNREDVDFCNLRPFLGWDTI